MKYIIVVTFVLMMAMPAAASAADHAGFTTILADHVKDGGVDYASLCEDERLIEYTEWLSSVDPASLGSDAERLAFWINAYNAFTLQLICDNYPLKSINDLHFGGRLVSHVIKKTAWDKEFIEINGETYNLNNIEHDIIRKQFDDARIHFALVCAAKSCPPLRSEAFIADRLDEQLESQGRVFFMESSKNRVDIDAKTIYLSKILDWYEGDFGENKQEVVAYILRYLPEDVAAAIKNDPDAWRVKYTDYDWALND